MAKEEMSGLKILLFVSVCLSILVISALSIFTSIMFSNFLTVGFSALVAILLVGFSAILSYFSLSSFFEDEKSLLIATILISIIASAFAIGAYIGNNIITDDINSVITAYSANSREIMSIKYNINISASSDQYTPLIFKKESLSPFLFIPTILILYNLLPVLFLMLRKK